MNSPKPLEGLKVVDCATLLAGPLLACLMADFGATVTKVEHPNGDSLRAFGWNKDGESLWWAFAARNKRCITLKLSDERGQELLKGLVRDADVLIENFRPGTMERWNLGPDVLLELNPRLVMVRNTGFGQTGPYADRAGFGTLAEAMSGFAHTNGWPDGPPTLPSFALGDAVAALTGCYAAMFALWWRDHGGGVGQVIDLSIYEPMFWLLGPQALAYDQLGVVPGRTGNRTSFSAPRNAYRTKDGRWLALSASSQSVAERVMRIVGRDDLIDEPWFADQTGRLEHADALDAIIGEWIESRTTEDVLAAFVQGEAAIAPIYSVEDAMTDPQYLARETVATVQHPALGDIRMPNVFPRLSATPGEIRHPGPALGEHNVDVFLGELGIERAEFDDLRDSGVI